MARPLAHLILDVVSVSAVSGCAGGGTQEAIPAGVSPTSVQATAVPGVCRDKAFMAMRDALIRDGNLDSLPKLPDRSMGISECRGLTKGQLDAIAAGLQRDLSPYLLGAAAGRVGSPTS